MSPAPDTPFATRFAPSPTGDLHRGHAFSALTAERAAREAGGRFLLRLEDIDRERCRPQFEASILDDLAWLGLQWQAPARRQSDHMADYQAALDFLHRRGLTYRCFRTRREVMQDIGRAPEAGQAPAFRGGALAEAEEIERLAAGQPYAWRLSLDAAGVALGRTWNDLSFVEQGRGPGGEHGLIRADPTPLGDVILARKDLGVAYHLAVVVDDGLQGISHVVRGEDLFEAAHVQRLLQALLGLPTPLYRHHRLLLRPDGRKFAKRDTTETLQGLRAAGKTAQELRRDLGFD